MNKYLACFCAVVFFAGISSVKAQSDKIGCGTNAAWQTEVQLHPSLVQQREQMEKAINEYIQNHDLARTADVDSDGVRVIPTVFHILYDQGIGSVANISDAQVRSCIQTLNIDYRRQNADAQYTLVQFKPVAADTKIEFQLATTDPQGNSTNGITRTFTNRTEQFVTPYGLSIINWPSNKYLNIWVVYSILTGAAGLSGEVIGLGTLPPTPSGEDGVVLKYSFVGKIGSANNFYAGRDADHEVGHYLNMIHTWGDANCGNDQVDDTPTEYGPYYGCPCGGVLSDTCYVYDDSCGSPNPPGIMYQNYMDYTDGNCKNLFTNGQKERMRATLSTYRFSLWQPSNLAATGTDSASISYKACPTCNSDSFNNPHCAPVANFTPEHSSICPGSTIQYRENTTNGTPTSWVWSFPGGTPSSYTGQIPPAIRYSSQGAYHAILTVSNSEGSSTMDKGSCAIVDWGFGIDNVPFFESFEENQPVPNEWRVFNDDGGPAWQQTDRAAYSGSHSMSIQNYESLDATKPNYTAPGSVKELQSPSINFTYVKAVNDATLTFRLAYGQQYSANTDSLSIDYSINCGASWTELKKLTGSALAAGSGGVQQGDFVPANQSQWALVSIPLYSTSTKTISPAIVGNDDVKFRFYFQTGLLSNNVYIDSLNINYIGALGVSEEPVTSFEFNAVPNPASQSFMVTYFLKQSEDLIINLYDLQGRLIRQLVNTHESPGSYENTIDGRSFNLASGMYVLKMITSDGVASKKLIYSKD